MVVFTAIISLIALLILAKLFKFENASFLKALGIIVIATIYNIITNVLSLPSPLFILEILLCAIFVLSIKFVYKASWGKSIGAGIIIGIIWIVLAVISALFSMGIFDAESYVPNK